MGEGRRKREKRAVNGGKMGGNGRRMETPGGAHGNG